MKKNFAFVLRGGDWWKPFLIFWVVFLVVYIPMSTTHRWPPSVAGHPGAFLPILFGLTAILVLAQAIFLIVVLRIMLPKLSIDGKSFEFRGSIERFVGINVIGYLLTLVTLTVYAPWYARRVTAYLVSQTTFDGVAPEFLGRGGRLFVCFVLALWIPIIVVTVVIALSFGFPRGATTGTPGSVALTVLTWIVTSIILIPFVYLVYRWYVNIGWNETIIRWQTHFWPSVGFLLGQLLLVLITVGIYWPAAFLRIYRYFVSRTVVLDQENRELGRLGFEGSIGNGFWMIWGRTLLAIITVGVYIPWAWAAVGRWLFAASFYHTAEPGS